MKFKEMAKRSGVYIFLQLFIIVVVLGVIGGGTYAYQKYKSIYEPNIFMRKNKSHKYLYVATGTNMSQLTRKIFEDNYVKDTNSFKWVAKQKKFATVYPGRYLIKDSMSNNELINKLRIGAQDPINFTINFYRFKENIIQKAAELLEADMGELSLLINDEEYLKEKNLNPHTAISIFIPNTYQFNWNTSAREFLDRMYDEYQKFWNEDRLAQARKIGLTPEEVVILASIVDREARYNDEKPRIAGVYMNRLKKGIRLQADPTVVYAVGNFNLRRVLTRHTKSDSPYNTYRNKGLPPGPICTPAIISIDAVLNYEKHKYIYFCAKEDFTGYHNFAVTHAQHSANAKKFQRALNRRKIYK